MEKVEEGTDLQAAVEPPALQVPQVDRVVQTAAQQVLGGGAEAHARLPFLEHTRSRENGV